MKSQLSNTLAIIGICFAFTWAQDINAQNLVQESQELATLIKLKDSLQANLEVNGGDVEVYYNGILDTPNLPDGSKFTFTKEGTYRFRNRSAASSLTGIFHTVNYKNDSILFVHTPLQGSYQEIIVTYYPDQSLIIGEDDLLVIAQNSLSSISGTGINAQSISTTDMSTFEGPNEWTIQGNTYPVDSHQIMVFYPIGNDSIRVLRRSKAPVDLQYKNPIWPILKALVESDQSQRPMQDFLDDLRSNEYLSKNLGYWLNLDDRVFMEMINSVKDTNAPTTPISKKLDKINNAPPEEKIKQIINASNKTAGTALVEATQEVYSTKSFLSSLNQAAILEGLTSFIEKRAQEELNILFLNRLSKKLDESEIGILFPKTKLLFERFEISNYKSLLDNALPYMEDDIKNIGLNLSKVIVLQDTLTSEPAIYNNAFLLQLVNQAILQKPLDSLVIYSYDFYQSLIDKFDKERFEAIISKTKNDPELITEIETLLDSLNRASSEIRGLRETLKNQIKAAKGIYSSDLRDDPFLLSSESWSKRAEVMNDKLGNQISLLDNAFEESTLNEAQQLKTDFNNGALFKNAKLSDYNELFNQAGGPLDTRFQFIPPIWELERQLTSRRYLEEMFTVQNTLGNELLELQRIRHHIILQQKAQVLERAVRAYQTHWMLKAAVQVQIAAIQKQPQKVAGIDSLAMVFFDSVLTNDLSRNAIQQLENNFFQNTVTALPSKTARQGIEYLQEQNKAILPYLLPRLDSIDQYTEVKLPKQQLSFDQLKAHIKALKKGVKDNFDLVDQNSNGSLNATISANVNNLIKPYLDSIKQVVNAIKDQKLGDEDNLFFNFVLTPDDDQQDAVIKKANDLIKRLDQVHDQSVLLQGRISNQLPKMIHQLEQETLGTARLKSRANAENMRAITQLALVLLDAFYLPEATPPEKIEVPSTLQFTTTMVGNANNANNPSISVVKQDSIVTQVDTLKFQRRWMTKDSFRTIMDDPIRKEVFLGVLQQRIQKIDHLPLRNASPQIIVTQLINVLNESELLHLEIEKKKTLGQSMRLSDYLPLARNTSDLLGHLLNIPSNDGATLGQKYKLTGAITIFDEILDLYQHLDQKKYLLALGNAVGVYSEIKESFETEKSTRSAIRNEVKEAVGQADGIKGKLEARQQEKTQGEQDYISSRSFANFMSIYGNFMAELVQANNSNQVKALLQKYALPVGSSQIKRMHNTSIGVQSYLGFAANHEVLDGTPTKNRNFSASLAVPFGLAYSFRWGDSKTKGYRKSTTLFASVLDLSPIATVHFGGDVVNASDNIQFGDFFAPGVFVFQNINRSPFSFGFGYQYLDSLRELKEGGATLSGHRFSINFLVDVPLFNFYTNRSK